VYPIMKLKIIHGEIPDAIGIDVTADDFPPPDIDRVVAIHMEVVCAFSKIQHLIVMQFHIEKAVDTLRIASATTAHKKIRTPVAVEVENSDFIYILPVQADHLDVPPDLGHVVDDLGHPRNRGAGQEEEQNHPAQPTQAPVSSSTPSRPP